MLAVALGLITGCDEGIERVTDQDGSFGRGVTQYPRDGGMDGSIPDVASAGLPLRVRFVHGLVSLGPLHVCHDADGAGAGPALPLATSEGALLRAAFRERSLAVTLPAVVSGTLTLQRTPDRDAGFPDAGAAALCAESLREATIPLPQDGAFLAPRAPLDEEALEALDVSPALFGPGSLTLVGSGLPLSAAALEARAMAARERALADRPADLAGATAAAELERRTLEAAFAPRLLIQRDPPAGGGQTFSLALLHAAPDVAGETSDAVGAVRLCITAGTRESSAIPNAPLPGVPFRYRVRLSDGLASGIEYRFRVFAQRDFDAAKRDCSTISAPPLAERTTTRTELRAGHAYTLALYGAISPAAVCSPPSGSLVRPGCPHPAAELGAQLALLED